MTQVGLTSVSDQSPNWVTAAQGVSESLRSSTVFLLKYKFSLEAAEIIHTSGHTHTYRNIHNGHIIMKDKKIQSLALNSL